MADEEGVSSVLGAMLMLAMVMTLVPGAMMLHAAMRDEMAAHREAAERAAYCARHPDVGPPACEARDPMPGYDCRSVEGGAWLCVPENATERLSPGGPR